MTVAAVDLAAVARARTELARVVADHPHLRSPEAHARLVAALPALTESPMSRPLDPNHAPGSGASTTVGVRLAPDLLAAVDAEVDRLRALAPGSSFGRSDAVRSLLLRALSPTPPTTSNNQARDQAHDPSRYSSGNTPQKPATTPPALVAVDAAPLPLVAAQEPAVTELAATTPQEPVTPQLTLLPDASPGAPMTADEMRARIKVAGLSMRDLERATGIGHGSAHRFLRGGAVSPANLAKLARYVATMK